jgi:hypothetical protein
VAVLHCLRGGGTSLLLNSWENVFLGWAQQRVALEQLAPAGLLQEPPLQLVGQVV